MKRALVAVAAAGLLLGACGDSAKPKAFPGSALDKAKELARREAEMDLPNRSVSGAVKAYGTDGDGFCTDKDPASHKTLNVAAPLSGRELVQALADANLVVAVYCPWLSPYQKAVGP